VYYQDAVAVLKVPSGDILDGRLPQGKNWLMQALIEIHRKELMANWQLAVTGEQDFSSDTLYLLGTSCN
jgi:hypothetical protein